jgi:4-methylaminobutanoate oxidase (formaldehyde-forming)
VQDEQRATREDVVVFDQTSFAKFVLEGRDALALLQRLCANEIDVSVGRMVYTAMLNERGGFESDLTITRLAPGRFFILTGSAQATRDADWINRHRRDDEFAVLVDVTSAYSVLSVMGPKSAALLGALSADDVGKDALPFATTRDIDVGYARVRAARMSYVGGPGYELLVTTDQCLTLYEALFDAGAAFGLRDAGYYTIDALRIEAGRRAWGAELGPDETPWEAGLAYAVKLDKSADFLGKAALVRQREQGIKKRLVVFTFDDPAAFAWGGEPILMDGRSVGELTSAGYSRKLGRVVAMGYARSDEAFTDERVLAARYEVDVAGEVFAVTAHLALRCPAFGRLSSGSASSAAPPPAPSR